MGILDGLARQRRRGLALAACEPQPPPPSAPAQATADTLSACTGCHAAYRQEVVDAATWEARSGSSVGAMAH